MTPTPSNQHPNGHGPDQPISRLNELLADRAVQGLSEGEQSELRQLLAAAGKAEDTTLDLAAAACDRAFNHADTAVELPASLLAALDREGDAWCAGVSSQSVAGRIHDRAPFRSDVGRGHAVRTPFKRFTREYGGWLAAAACLAFGIYTLSTQPTPGTTGPAPFKGAIIADSLTRPIENMALSLRQRAVERLERWFKSGSDFKLVPLATATPDAGTDLAVGQVMWNAEEGTGVLQIKGLDESKTTASRTYRINVYDAKTGKQMAIQTGTVTLHPGQKDVIVPIDSDALIRDAAAFVVSVCSQGPMGVPQNEGVVGISSFEGVNPAAPAAPAEHDENH